MGRLRGVLQGVSQEVAAEGFAWGCRIAGCAGGVAECVQNVSWGWCKGFRMGYCRACWRGIARDIQGVLQWVELKLLKLYPRECNNTVNGAFRLSGWVPTCPSRLCCYVCCGGTLWLALLRRGKVDGTYFLDALASLESICWVSQSVSQLIVSA